VSTKAHTERKGKENQKYRTPLRAQADTATQAQAQQARWAIPWREHAPHAVATVERDGVHTFVCSHIAGLDVTWIRTTSLLERTTRE